jgi:hypothetical protein
MPHLHPRRVVRELPTSEYRLRVKLKETRALMDEICERLNVFALARANRRWAPVDAHADEAR